MCDPLDPRARCSKSRRQGCGARGGIAAQRAAVGLADFLKVCPGGFEDIKCFEWRLPTFKAPAGIARLGREIGVEPKCREWIKLNFGFVMRVDMDGMSVSLERIEYEQPTAVE